MDVHQSMGHLSQENVQISLRQKYWVFKGRAALWRVLSKPPFSNVGIDFFDHCWWNKAEIQLKMMVSFLLLNYPCDCQQSQVSTRKRFKIYFHYGWSWSQKEQIITSYYEVEGIGKRKTTEEIQSDKGRHLQRCMTCKHEERKSLKRSLWRNHWYSNVKFFEKLFMNEIKQSRIMRKNLTEYKSRWMRGMRKQ